MAFLDGFYTHEKGGENQFISGGRDSSWNGLPMNTHDRECCLSLDRATVISVML